MNKQIKKLCLQTVKGIAVGTMAFLLVCGIPAKNASAAIEPGNITSVKEAKEEPSISETLTLDAASDSKKVTTVNMEHAGVLELTAKVTSTTSNIHIELFSDEACTQVVGSSINLSSTMTEDTAVYSIRTAGTYYLCASYSTYDSQANTGNDISFYASCFIGEDDVLKAGNTALSYTADKDLTIYHQITVKKSGVITLKGSGYYLSTMQASDIFVTLYDSDKNPISQECQLYSANKYKSQYVVSKGTYYIGVCEYNLYTLRYTFQPVKETSYGSSDKNASAIAANSSVTGILANGSSSDNQKWYKLKLKKETRVTITLAGTGTNKSYCSAQLYANKNGKLRKVASRTANNNGKKPSYLTKSKKLDAGIYYIAVGKADDVSGSSYTIRLQDS